MYVVCLCWFQEVEAAQEKLVTAGSLMEFGWVDQTWMIRLNSCPADLKKVGGSVQFFVVEQLFSVLSDQEIS